MIYSILFALLIAYANYGATDPECSTDPVLPATLMASDDGGLTWQDLSRTLPDNVMPYHLMVSHDIAYMGAGYGLYTCRGNDMEWAELNVQKRNIGPISEGREGPYVIVYEDGIYQVRDGEWVPLPKPHPDEEIYTIYEGSDGLYLGCQSGIYRSANGGSCWRHVFDEGPTGDIKEINGYLFTSTTHTIWRSADNGYSWESVYTGSGSPFCLRAFNNTVLAIVNESFPGMGGIHTVYQSMDNGVTWQSFNQNMPEGLSDVLDIREVGETLIASSGKGLFRSTDLGKPWVQVLAIPEGKGGFFRLAVDESKLYSLWVVGC